MNKETYINLLKERLKKLPKDEFEKAIDYFEEYFAEAGVENEARAIEDLGSAQEAADRIIREFAIKNSSNQEAKKDVKKGFTGVWIAILAICASPIALPLLIALLGVVLAVFICVVAIFFALGISGLACLITAPFMLVGGFTILVQSFPNFLVCLGGALIAAALGILIMYAAYLLIRKFLYWLVIVCGRLVKKGGKHHENQ